MNEDFSRDRIVRRNQVVISKINSLQGVSVRVPIVVMKYQAQKQLRREGVYLLAYPESQSMREAKTGAQKSRNLET